MSTKTFCFFLLLSLFSENFPQPSRCYPEPRLRTTLPAMPQEQHPCLGKLGCPKCVAGSDQHRIPNQPLTLPTPQPRKNYYFFPFPAKDFASVPVPISDAILSLEMLRWETQMHTNRNGANKAHAPTVSARAAERPASLPAQSPHACADYKPTPRELRRGFAGAFFSEVAREG